MRKLARNELERITNVRYGSFCYFAQSLSYEFERKSQQWAGINENRLR